MIGFILVILWNYLIALLIRWGIVMSFQHDPGVTGIWLITLGLHLMIAGYLAAREELKRELSHTKVMTI